MIEGPRPVKPSEYPGLLRLVNKAFMGPKWGKGMEMLFPWHLGPENRNNLWVFAEDGRVVSHVGVTKRTITIRGVRIPAGLMSAVVTDPEYRGKGLATRLIDFLKQRHDRQGIDLYLISGDRDLYRRIGAVPVGRRLHFTLAPQALTLFAHPEVACRAATAGDLKHIARLYAEEPVRIIRPDLDFRRVFRAGWAALSPARFYVAETGGKVTAYFVAGVTRKAGLPSDGRLHVIEAGGARTDLLAALHTACRTWDKRRVELSVSAHDRESLALLTGRHLGERRVPVYDSVAILNPGRLIRRLKPWLAQRGGPAGRKLEGGEHNLMPYLALGSSRIELTREALTQLVFGEPHRDRPKGLRASGSLDTVLRKAFPLPLANPGISYV